MSKIDPREQNFEHPSQGQIVISKPRSSKGIAFYGSDNLHSEFVSISIYDSSHRSAISSNYYHAGRLQCEIRLTPLQWAEMVSSFGDGGGTPCTFDHKIEGKMIRVPEYPMPEARKEKFKTDMSEMLQDGADALKELEVALKKTLNTKGPVPKRDLEQMLSTLIKAQNAVGPNIDYVQEVFHEHVEKQMAEARMEVEASIANRMHRLGLKAMQTESSAALPDND